VSGPIPECSTYCRVVTVVKRERPVQGQPTPEEFEEFVAAALKVDPKGLSGKHRKDPEKQATVVRPRKQAH